MDLIVINDDNESVICLDDASDNIKTELLDNNTNKIKPR